jgi:hypothetical protein
MCPMFDNRILIIFGYSRTPLLVLEESEVQQ